MTQKKANSMSQFIYNAAAADAASLKAFADQVESGADSTCGGGGILHVFVRCTDDAATVLLQLPSDEMRAEVTSYLINPPISSPVRPYHATPQQIDRSVPTNTTESPDTGYWIDWKLKDRAEAANLIRVLAHYVENLPLRQGIKAQPLKTLVA